MATVSDVARQVLSDVASDAGHVLAAQWVAKRYEEMVTKVRYRHLRKVGAVVQPATIDDGTVTLMQGSDLVVGDTTALAAWRAIPNNGIVGRFFRGQDLEWYEIIEFVSTSLRLSTPYVIAGGSGIGYNIAARYLTLAPDARWLGTFTHMRLQNELEVIPLDTLNDKSPSRPWAQGVPCYVAEVGTTIGSDGKPGTRQVEVYPYAAQDEHLTYVYWSLPLTLGFDDEIPRVIPSYTLKDGALINAMRYEMSKALRAGQMDAAAHWRNEYRAQETVWKTKLADAARADRGTDDVSVLIQGYGSPWEQGFVRTAHDLAFAGGGGGGGGSNVTKLQFVMAGGELTYQISLSSLPTEPLFSTTWNTNVSIQSQTDTLLTVAFDNPPSAGDLLNVVLT